MRRIAFLLLALALVVPSAALAGRSAQGDGSLVVANADGTLTVQVKGVIFGHFDRGRMTVVEYKADSANALPTVSGAKWDVKGAKLNVVYNGKDVRFLFPSGTFTLKFEGTGIDLSAVGKGSLVVGGKISPSDDGTVSVNGAKPTGLTSLSLFGGATLSVTASVEKTNGTDKTSGTVTTSNPSGR
jgi:hypothetical protein